VTNATDPQADLREAGIRTRM